ncbi:MAG TPA: CRTAC1 family protein [Acidimicrobiia bacterium]|nr:CRTAC1 family protein [Acidimicrobiia bacterium]
MSGPGPRGGVVWFVTGAALGLAVAGAIAWAAINAIGSETPTAAGPPLLVEETTSSDVGHVYGGDYDHYVGGGVAVFDCDSDRKPDLYVAGGSGPAGLYRNISDVGGTLEFTALLSAETDLDGVTGGYPLDVDSDGHVDLAVLRHGENVVLKGQGDCRFARANEAWGIDGGDEWTVAFSATWRDDADFPTLAFGNYREIVEGGYGPGCEDNYLVEPEGAGYRGAREPLSPGWCTLSALFSDWSGRGKVDLRFTNDRHYYVDGEEQLWDVSGDVNRLYGREDGWQQMKIWGMGIASHDITGDGLAEVYLTSQGDNKLQTLAEGPGQPHYEDIALIAGATAHRPFTGDNLKPSTAWHAEFDDVNNDSLIDLLVTKGNVEAQAEFAADDPNNLLLGQADRSFVEGAEGAGFLDFDRSRGAALADLNLDGWLDVVVVERTQPVRIWRNTGPEAGGGHWVQIALEQPGSNRDAIGSWIEARIGTATLRREVTVGGGHAGGQLGFSHLGLGPSDQAEIRVIWPDGEAGPWHRVEADRFVTITRGAAAPELWDPSRD